MNALISRRSIEYIKLFAGMLSMRGMAPIMRDAVRSGIWSSNSNVSNAVRSLAGKGVLTREPEIARGIRLNGTAVAVPLNLLSGNVSRIETHNVLVDSEYLPQVHEYLKGKEKNARFFFRKKGRIYFMYGGSEIEHRLSKTVDMLHQEEMYLLFGNHSFVSIVTDRDETIIAAVARGYPVYSLKHILWVIDNEAS